jgi:cell wall-associated NlpC family hydrolase
MTQDDIIDAALECVGTPFMHQGRLLSVALDCAGVAVHVCNRLSLEPEDLVGYGRTPLNGLLQARLDAQQFLTRVSKTEIQSGDILLMKFLGEPQHIAVMGHDEVIHAYEAVGKCVRHPMDKKWWNRVVHGYRFNGVTL